MANSKQIGSAWGRHVPCSFHLSKQTQIQQLMANATPDEKAELEKIADKMRARAAVAAPATPTTNYGTTGYAPQSPAAASPWVTAEPEVAIPDTSGLTPEQRREQAREKARAAATVCGERGTGVNVTLRRDTHNWWPAGI